MRASLIASLGAATCLFSTGAGAEDLARAYLHDSTSITGGVSLNGYARSGTYECGVGIGATLRRVTSSWAFEGRLAANVAYGENELESASPHMWEFLSLGGAVGRGIALGDRVMLTPMLSFGVGAMSSATGGYRSWMTFTVQAAVELPLTVMLSRAVYYEPYLSLAHTWTPADDPSTTAWFGQRFGVIF